MERDRVARARAGDERAFRALYEVAFRLSWAFLVRRTGDPRLAEALTARALRRAFASLDAFDGAPHFGAWVLAHAQRALRDAKPDACPPVDGRAG